MKEGSFRVMEFSVPSYDFIKNRLEKSIFSHMRKKLRISPIDYVRENTSVELNSFQIYSYKANMREDNNTGN